MTSQLPIIDVSSLIVANSSKSERDSVAQALGAACRDNGFFYVKNHGVDATLEAKIEALAKDFFSRPVEEKMQIAMKDAGRAWRGYFKVGAELTSNSPDWKEGIYFGTELANNHPLVRQKTPMHGANLFLEKDAAFRQVVLDYMDAVEALGHALMKGLSLSLGLDENYFSDRYTKDPLILFRIFNYPAPKTVTEENLWGVGEHTDYGVLTILKQDDCGGLEVKVKGTNGTGWIEAPPVPGTFVCNIGDMLDRMTGGLYKSTPHRVRNASGRDRLSFPLFFDPNFFATVKSIEGLSVQSDDAEERWDRASVHTFEGTYGAYLLGKVAKAFPELKRDVLGTDS